MINICSDENVKNSLEYILNLNVVERSAVNNLFPSLVNLAKENPKLPILLIGVHVFNVISQIFKKQFEFSFYIK
jgi:hypothetical protein